MIYVLIRLVYYLQQIITILVIAQVIMSYFVSPYNSIRMAVDRIVEPMLAPIRRVLPSVGMLDFSPFVLIILVQILGTIIITFLSRI